jgi:hypothetical protein
MYNQLVNNNIFADLKIISVIWRDNILELLKENIILFIENSIMLYTVFEMKFNTFY